MDSRIRRKVCTLVACGKRVDIIALRTERKSIVYKQDGATIYALPISKKRQGKIRYLFEYSVFWVSSCILLTCQFLFKNYNVVDVSNLPDFLVFAAWFPKLMGARIILDMHEITPEFYMSKYGIKQSSFLFKFLVLIESLSCFFADEVVASNDLIAQKLETRGLPKNKLTVVVNTADERMFRSVKKGTLTNNRQRETIVFMYHGTITPIYGLDIALEALAIVKNKFPKRVFQCIFLGDGPMLENLRIKRDRLDLTQLVVLKDAVPFQRISEYLSLCDIGLVPTRQDAFLDLSFSNKLVEYVVCRKPVIAARLNGYKRYFREESMIFFNPNDSLSLADAIYWTIKNRSAWPKITENALQDYQAISWNIMGKRYMRIINYPKSKKGVRINLR
jgi:glycosyltransferase involved in cell wall biosynthesis